MADSFMYGENQTGGCMELTWYVHTLQGWHIARVTLTYPTTLQAAFIPPSIPTIYHVPPPPPFSLSPYNHPTAIEPANDCI